jgi:hypothetical protein
LVRFFPRFGASNYPNVEGLIGLVTGGGAVPSLERIWPGAVEDLTAFDVALKLETAEPGCENTSAALQNTKIARTRLVFVRDINSSIRELGR